MEGKKFAKIFDLKDGSQVLVQKKFGDDQDPYFLEIRTDIEDDNGTMEAIIKAGFDEEEPMNESFNGYDMEAAKKYRETILNMMNDGKQ